MIILREVDVHYAITADLWTSRRQHSYLSVSIFFVDNSTLRSICLCVQQISGAHTGETIASEIHKVLTNFGIEKRVLAATTDNASNIKEACQILDVS